MQEMQNSHFYQNRCPLVNTNKNENIAFGKNGRGQQSFNCINIMQTFATQQYELLAWYPKSIQLHCGFAPPPCQRKIFMPLMIYAHSSLCFDQRGSPECTDRHWWLLLIRCCLGLHETRLECVLNRASQRITSKMRHLYVEVICNLLDCNSSLYFAWSAFASKFIACQVMWVLLNIAADNFLLVSVKGIVLGLISQMSSSEWKCQLYVNLVSCGSWVSATKLITTLSMDKLHMHFFKWTATNGLSEVDYPGPNC